MAEHWLYLPSIGIFILIAKGLNSAYRIKKFKITSVVLIIGLVSFYSYLTIRQNVYWREPIAFYERTLKFAPDSARVYNNLGDEYIRAGNRDKPMGLYEKATQLNPNYTEAFNNLGCELFNSGKLDEAISSFEKAIKSDPAYAESHANLAIIYEQKKQYDLAIKHFDRAKELGLEVTDLSEKLKPYRK
jgi:tetratricopeptide (TPR) repeat protein